MSWLHRLFQSRRLEDQLDAELRDHFERQVADQIKRGLSPIEARRATRLAFGGLDQIKEDCRDARGTRWLESAGQDARFALRTLRRSPGFALAAICTLALGIGANTAIFSVVYAVLLKPLPYTQPDQLVTLATYVPQFRAQFPTIPVRATDFVEFRKATSVFSALSALIPEDFNLTGTGEPERLYGARASANVFTLLGVSPHLGRTFLPEEDQTGHDHVAIISHQLWQRRFGGDPNILHHSLTLNGQPFTVVGVLPANFVIPTGTQLHPLVAFGPRIDIWKPMAFTAEELGTQGSWNWAVVGRLQPGVSLARALAETDAIAAQLARRIPQMHLELGTLIVPLREAFSGNIRQGLMVLLGAVALLLLIGCVNLANLLLARMSSRNREFATRVALGAPRSRLVRQLLTESLALSFLGGVAGILVAWSGVRVLVSLAPADLSGVPLMHLDGPVLLFTTLASLAAGVAFGLVPAFETARGGVHENLKEGSRGTTSGRAGRLRRVLVTVECALCTGLLAAAGLLLHSFVQVMSVEKGFAVEKILSAEIALPAKQYDGERAVTFYRQLLDRIRSLPGVASAGASTALPLQHEADTTQIFYESDTRVQLDRPVAAYRTVTPGYFSTMGISLLAGRFLEDRESELSVVIGKGLAHRLWPADSPSAVVGRRLRMGDVNNVPLRVVGVVVDVRTGSLEREAIPCIYRPHSQAPVGQMTVVMRTSSDPESLAAATRAAIWSLDRDLPVASLQTMSQVVSASVAGRRFQMLLVVLFASLSLVLALVGIYGVTSYSVARQTQEIGLRMALGAAGPDVMRSVIVQGLRPVAIGLVLGLFAARLAALAIRSFLFGVGPLDPLALGGVAFILLATAALACYLPARRASRLDPVIALRCE